MLYGFEEHIGGHKETEQKPQELGSYILDVYNTCSGKIEPVEVSREIYLLNRRNEWRDAKRDRSFYAHEIQFTSMRSDEDTGVEGFHEFICKENDPSVQLLEQETINMLWEAVRSLSTDEQAYIKAIYENNMTEKDLAAVCGISQQAVSKKLQRILKKIKKYLEERL